MDVVPKPARRIGLVAAIFFASVVVFHASPSWATIEGDSWFPIGPAPIDGFFAGGATGRASAIAVNPQNPDEVYLGTAAGGVWRTRDGGTNWKPVTDKQAALAIGSIALAGCSPVGCTRIYAGTGENAIRRDTYYGAGLLVGVWSGGEFPSLNWTLRKGDPFDFTRGSIVDVVVDPTTSGSTTRVFVALSRGVTVSATEATVIAPAPASGGSGLYKSEDNGVTWQKLVVAGSAGAQPTDLKIDPSDANILYAGFLGRGIFKSDDKGATWCPLNEGVPSSDPSCADASGLPNVSAGFDHVELAVWPTNTQVIYARFGFCTDRLIQNCIPGVYKSSDGGLTWSERLAGNSTHNASGPKGYSRYTHAIAIDPTNQNTILLGGINLWRSIDGGQTYSTTDTNIAPAAPGGGLGVVHSDHREVVFHSAEPSRVYNTSDGGFAFSIDGGQSWRPGNDDLQITGFQSIGASPLVGAVIGASQDNGGQLWTGSRRWEHLSCCGDGGFAFLDFDDAMTLYAASNFGNLKRSTDGGSFWDSINFGISSNDPRLFYAPFVQGPGPGHRLYFGANKLYRSTNNGNSWADVSPVLATGTSNEIVTAISTLAHVANPTGSNVITAIGVAPGSPNSIYVGYYGGEIFATTAPCTMSSCWPRIDSATLPNAPVTRIAVHPTNSNIAYVTFSGFGSAARIWKTVNGGSNWSPIVTGIPPRTPANTITIEPSAPDRIWVGLDSGPDGASLFKSLNGGADWFPFSKSLPNAPVYEIVIDETHGRVYAATHGRGAFVLGKPFISTFEGWVGDDIWDVPIYGQNFLPNQSCTVRILQSTGLECASGSKDAIDGDIKTNGDGVLMTSKGGFYNAKPIVWGCLNGTCIGGTPIAQCNDDADGDGDKDPLSTVIVKCGDQVATTTVRGCPTLANPPSTTLGLDMDGTAGGGGAGGGEIGAEAAGGAPASAERTFELSATIQARDGARSLCSVSVTARPGDSNVDVLARVEEALNASRTCSAAGVKAVLDKGAAGEGEDEFPREPSLTLDTIGVAAAQVLTTIHAAPGEAQGSCYAVRGLGIPILNQLHVIEVGLETAKKGAGGGQVTVLEQSRLGTCQVSVPTKPGESAATIAQRLHDAFQAPGIPGPNPDCPSERNPRDISLHGDSLITVSSTAVKFCTTDPGVGFRIRSEELKNVHPIADAGPDRTIETESVDGTAVKLDGSGSSDPDSTPGTNDDIVRFEWFELGEGGGLIPLATGETATVQLAPGTHVIRLRVTDKGRLRDTDDVEIIVRLRKAGLDPRYYALIRSLEDMLKNQQKLLISMGVIQRELLGAYELTADQAVSMVEDYYDLVAQQQQLVAAFQKLVNEIAALEIEARKRAQIKLKAITKVGIPNKGAKP